MGIEDMLPTAGQQLQAALSVIIDAPLDGSSHIQNPIR